MAKVALENASTSNSTASNHIYYRKWEYQYTTPPIYNSEGVLVGGNVPVYGWNYYYANATVSGNCKSTVSNVKIQGKAPIVKGDKTTESDSYSISGSYVSGSHSNATGSITGGNSRNVYANGKLISTIGASITTHASTSATINGGGSSSVNVG